MPWDGLARSVSIVFWALVLFAIINSTLANANAGANVFTRTAYAFGRVGAFPRWFAEPAPEVQVAACRASWSSCSLSLAVGLALGFKYTPQVAFGIIGTALVVIVVPVYIATNIACIGFFARHRRDEQHWVLHIIVPIIGALLLIPGFFSVAGITGIPGLSFISALTSPYKYAPYVMAAWLVFGVVILFWLRAQPARHRSEGGAHPPRRRGHVSQAHAQQDRPPAGAMNGGAGWRISAPAPPLLRRPGLDWGACDTHKGGDVPLPVGYILRHPEAGEAPAIQAILDACETVDTGEPRRHDTDVANEWLNPRSRPDEDWWVAVAPDGELAAVGWVWRQTTAEITADHYVHPDHRGRGLGDAMLDAIEARVAELPARTPDGVPRSLVVWCEDSDIVRRASLDRRGFRAIRQYFEMAAGSRGRPRGAAVARRHRRPSDAGRASTRRSCTAPTRRPSSEHHLYEPRPYDEWRLAHLDRPDSDPSLWWLAWDGDELVGFALPFLGAGGAVIGDLAVRKPWRGRGIGHALLLAAVPHASGAGSGSGASVRGRPERDRTRSGSIWRPACTCRAASTCWRSRSPDALGRWAGRRFRGRDVLRERQRAGPASCLPPGPRRSRQTESVPGASVAGGQLAATVSLRKVGMLRTPISAMNASRTSRLSSSGQTMPFCAILSSTMNSA